MIGPDLGGLGWRHYPIIPSSIAVIIHTRPRRARRVGSVKAHLEPVFLDGASLPAVPVAPCDQTPARPRRAGGDKLTKLNAAVG